MKVANVLESNKIIDYKNQKLILLDFWATWCGPCIPATEQLEVLQKQYANELFMISITDEQKNAVQKYLKKRPIDLMVVTDQDSYTFSRYNVISRPYAVLFTTEGDIIWKGHPGDLTDKKINVYLKKYRGNKSKKLSSFMKVVKQETVKLDDINTYEIEKVSGEATHYEDFYKEDEKFIEFRGDLSVLMAKLLNIATADMIADFTDFKVSFKANRQYYTSKNEELLNEVLNKYHLRMEKESQSEQVNELKVVNSNMLWRNDQINWSEGSDENSSNFLITTDRIEADNLTIRELANLLSDVKGISFVYNGKDENLYDWNLHYLHDNLFREDLEDTFGIKVQQKVMKITKIRIKKE
ncbi:hypothetical protein NBRC110019_29170 [Neptunitalea chrysea]|uniref:Thioredoxin domain-containing protein n=2 Tax=Neptunitalea chrysea TaxID=1647581 RepID=A0A9W6B7C7_9FLAO|nr:hypothetical protein NBRC110019_29170 [Neptunitalea chrysea]